MLRIENLCIQTALACTEQVTVTIVYPDQMFILCLYLEHCQLLPLR